MLRRNQFLGIGIVSCAAILTAADMAQAQRTFVSVGVGVGRPYGWYGGGFYYPYYPRYYAVPVYPGYYVAPTVVVAPSVTVPSVTVPSVTAPSGVSSAVPAVSANAAQVQVILPDADGEVWMQGRKMPSNGSATRVFTSPSLEPGRSYTYTVTAAWFRNGKMVKEERSVPVTAGATQVVDFRGGGGSGVEELPLPKPTSPK
jgi:uncharacterized protein (TIGR03000 family)